MRLDDRIRGGMYGVAVGDALGATAEFMTQKQIREKYGMLQDIIGGGWLNLKPGEWTDDTEMTLAVAEGIMEEPDHPIGPIGRHFLQWRQTNPPDIGSTIRATFKEFDTINSRLYTLQTMWFLAAQKVHSKTGRTAGNGALMRTIPVALAYEKEEEIYQHAIDIARMTHWDPRAGLTCALYCIYARYLLIEKSRRAALSMARNALRYFNRLQTQKEKQAVTDIEALFNEPTKQEWLKPTGYTIDSLKCALWSFVFNDTFEETVIEAVNLGGDADTIGAIAGGLAGVYYGYNAIPERFIEKFSQAQRNRLDTVTARLCTRNKQIMKEGVK